MSRKRFYITVLILFLAFVVQHVFIKMPDILKRGKVTDTISNIEIKCLDGSFEPIGYYKDKKPVAMIFWASSSDPSRLALEDLSGDYDKWEKEYDFAMIAVNVGESTEKIEQTKSLWNIAMKIGLDQDKTIAGKFGIGALPTLILIGKDGSIRRRLDQYDEDFKGRVRRYIRTDDDEDADTIIRINPDGPDTIMAGDSVIIMELEDE